MCEWGDTVDLRVLIEPHLSHTRDWRIAKKPVDRCISTIVECLNRGGVLTRSSCCGHGKGPGEIALQDGRVLEIKSDVPTGTIDTCEGCRHWSGLDINVPARCMHPKQEGVPFDLRMMHKGCVDFEIGIPIESRDREASR